MEHAAASTRSSPSSNPAVDNPATLPQTSSGNAAGIRPGGSLPSQWYRDPRIFDMERRAVWCKGWMLATHTSRFEKEGDYLMLELANYSYFIVRSRDGGFNAFHNVCRHRGYPLVQRSTGCSPILTCMYHGWSYSTRTGGLVKSTHSSFPDFVPAEHSLFRIHTHVNDAGFIFINFSAEEPVPFQEYFGDLDQQFKSLDHCEYAYAFSWALNGDYNWKTYTDGFQECIHCHLAHPGYANSLDLSTYSVVTKQNYALHLASLRPGAEQPAGGRESDAAPSFLYLFPSASVTVTPMMWYMMRIVPVSPGSTRMEYDVFRHKSFSVDHVRDYMQFYQTIEQEDFVLVTNTQKSLNAGIFRCGTLHPTKENGVIFYQGQLRNAVEEHLRIEKEIGHQWSPAQPLSQGGGKGPTKFCEPDVVCSFLGPEMMW